MPREFHGARLTAGAVAVTRLARAAGVAAPIRPTLTPMQSISVVIPAHNEARLLPRLLASITAARERYRRGADEIEVIVADNASADATAGIAERAGCTPYYTLVGRNVTERARAMVALRQERDLAESLVETAQMLVLLLDAEGRIVRCNRS